MYLSVLTICFFLLIAWAQKRHHRKLKVLMGLRTIGGASFKPIQVLKWACLFCALLCLMGGSRVPKWGVQRSSFSASKTAVLFVMDTSRGLTIPKSSETTWFSFGISAIRTLYTDITEGFYTAIMAFSSQSKLISPMSLDAQFAKGMLGTMYIDMPLQSEGAFKSLLQSINTVINPDHNTIVMIMSDGHSLPVISPRVLKKLHRKSVSFIIVGLGPTVNTPIPILGYSGEVIDYVKNSNGVTVLKSQNRASLNDMASALQGKFISIQTEDTAPEIYEKLRSVLYDHHRQLVSKRAQNQSKDQYFIFLIAAFSLLFIEELLVLKKGR